MVGILLKTRVGEKGQVVIPKPIREQLHIEKNTELEISVDDEKIVMKKKSDLELLNEIFNATPKMKLPKHIDWDALIYSQFEK